MSINRLEDKQLKQINELNEAFLASAVIRLLFGSKIKKALKQGVKLAKDDPELQAAYADLGYDTERMQDLIDDFCKRHPDAKNC